MARVSVSERHPDQRVFVDLSVKTETVARLKTQISPLQSQVKATSDDVRDRAKALDRVAQISRRVTAGHGELLAFLDLLEKCAI